MKVRRAVDSDNEAINAVHIHAYQVSYRGYLPDDYLDGMSNRKPRPADGSWECYVVEEQGKVIAFAVLGYPDEKTFEIDAIYVDPDFQKRGAGKLLMENICQMKKNLGYTKVVLWTLKNGPSVGFYQKMGLKQSNVPERTWRFNLPIIQFEKDL